MAGLGVSAFPLAILSELPAQRSERHRERSVEPGMDGLQLLITPRRGRSIRIPPEDAAKPREALRAQPPPAPPLQPNAHETSTPLADTSTDSEQECPTSACTCTCAGTEYTYSEYQELTVMAHASLPGWGSQRSRNSSPVCRAHARRSGWERGHATHAAAARRPFIRSARPPLKRFSSTQAPPVAHSTSLGWRF